MVQGQYHPIIHVRWFNNINTALFEQPANNCKLLSDYQTPLHTEVRIKIRCSVNVVFTFIQNTNRQLSFR